MEVFLAQFTSSCLSRYNVCVCFARAIFLPHRLIKEKFYCCEKYEVRVLLARCVDVFVEDLFMYMYVVSFRFVSKQRKTSNAVGMSSFGNFDYKQGSFGPRYVLIHFESLLGV